MDTRTERVVLILADISGYTRFMLANQTALAHAQMVITKLLEEIIREVEIPLEVKEIEGDAVFLYAVKPEDGAGWEETRRLIGRKLLDFFDAFARGIVAGSEFALCSCPSCQSVDQLKLKVVVHSGEAVFHEIGGFSDVSGVDVILAHKLLKNSVPSNEYILMTDAAYRDIEFPRAIEVRKGEEHYEGFGAVRTFTHLMDDSAPTESAVEALYADRGRAFATGLRLLGTGYFGQMGVLLRGRATDEFGKLGGVGLSAGARMAMLLREILLAPLFLPAGAIVQARRALARSTRAARRSKRAA